MSDEQIVETAEQVLPGDQISWSGRVITVDSVIVERGARRWRRGRYFETVVDGRPLRLHYFDDEVVTLAEGASQ